MLLLVFVYFLPSPLTLPRPQALLILLNGPTRARPRHYHRVPKSEEHT